MDEETDFYAEFHRLQDGLKKRLFKKVDYSSSADQFLELGNAMRREGNAPNAALCFMEAAQCYRAMKDSIKDAYYESEAGRLLWKTQLESELSDPFGLIGGYAAPLRELVPEAEDCFITAIETYLKMGEYNMASALYSELASNVYALDQKEQAAIYYEKAAQLLERDSPQMAAACIEYAINCKVHVGDFDGAHEVRRPVHPPSSHPVPSPRPTHRPPHAAAPPSTLPTAITHPPTSRPAPSRAASSAGGGVAHRGAGAARVPVGGRGRRPPDARDPVRRRRSRARAPPPATPARPRARARRDRPATSTA